MTDLIAELAEVVRLYRKAAGMKFGNAAVRALAKADDRAATFVCTHHAELEAMARDAELWRRTIDNTGDGLRVVVWKKGAPDDMDVLFPSPNLLKNEQYIDAAMHDSAREGGES